MRASAPLLTAACIALLPCLAQAASITVNPIRLEMAAGARATSLVISNEADEPVLLQAAVYSWTHDEHGADVLTPATEADAPLVTPPLFKLVARDASQVVRIGFRAPPPPGAELRWRIVVEEVPKAVLAPPGDATVPLALPVAVATRLRVSLPLLIAPATVHKQLSWVLRAVAGGLRLDAENLGSVTERLDRIELAGAGGSASLASVGGPIYLFPAERRSFELKPAAAVPPGALRLNLQGTAQPPTRELTVSAP